MKRVPFISLDGIDGTGKSTLCRMLIEWFQGREQPAIRCSDPGGTSLGDRLRAILLDSREEMTLPAEMFLFMASRAELVEHVIRPALAANTIVISDRFVMSNVVYQGHAGGLDPAELWRIGNVSTGGLFPDRTYILDLPVEAAVERRGRSADRMEARNREFQEKVRQGFLVEGRARPDRCLILDASPPIDVVFATIQKDVLQLCQEIGLVFPKDRTS